MTISLGKNINTVSTSDSNIVVLEPTINTIKDDVRNHLGETDDKMVLYDFLQILAEKVKITLTAIPPESKIKLILDE